MRITIIAEQAEWLGVRPLMYLFTLGNMWTYDDGNTT